MKDMSTLVSLLKARAEEYDNDIKNEKVATEKKACVDVIEVAKAFSGFYHINKFGRRDEQR
jgi:hypothetical protein